MSKDGFEFKEKYTDLRVLFPEIAEISEEFLDNIQSKIGIDDSKEKTNTYVLSIIAASLTIILFPFIVIKIYGYFDIVPKLLENILQKIPKESVDIFNFSFGVGSFSILTYLFLFPASKYISKIGFKNNPNKINKKQRSYILVSVIGIYIAFILIGFIALINIKDSFSILSQVYKYYFFIPVAIISLILFMFLLVIVFMLPFRKTFQNRNCHNSRIEISIILLKVLEKLKPYNNSDFIPQNVISSIVNKLYEAKLLIKKYPLSITERIYDKKIFEDFEKASYQFEKLIISIIESQETDLQNNKLHIIKYLNIFLIGNMKELPKSEEIIENKQTRTIRFYHYVILAMYMTLPIIIVLLLKLTFDFKFDNYSESLLRILYIIWAFVGVFSNPFTFNNDNKELMKDLVKTLLGKG
jgi:hypothetical protein